MPFLAHKIRLYPTNKQKTMLLKTVGTARFAYNWALNQWNIEYESGNKPNEAILRKQLNAIKKEQFPWMYDVSKCSVQQAIKNLGKAFNRFFKKQGNYPKFKKKDINENAYFDNISFRFRNGKIHFAKIGEIRIAEQLRFNGKLISATISKEANQWYVSVSVETGIDKLAKLANIIGIDVGVRKYKDSNGKSYNAPRSYRNNERKLRRLQQSLSRKVKGSNNRRKQKIKVAKCYLKIRNIRQDWLHKLTTSIVKNNQTIGIEDLNVKGMLRNKHLAKSISDACFGEFRRQLQYKAALYGRNIVIIPRFYPSSKLCSSCGTKTKSMSLSIREWKCKNCGIIHDRDINAAINIKNYAVSFTVTACGEFLPLVSSPVVLKSSSSAKQELNTESIVM